ncbi:MAG: electron transfer flavoprotein subunit alpha/FixB family protein [Desulfobacteraceae bacterium]|nr:electron transfer flavoprotein subunit alpha/FixB family protein [Desulfobacteraceae bacterium]
MKSSAEGIWIFVEQNSGEIADVSLEVLSKGRELADELGEQTDAAIFGDENAETAKILVGYGADNVHFINSPLLTEYCVELHEEVLFQLFHNKKPKIVLFGASLKGNDLACRLAARLNAGLVSDCIDLSLNEGGLLLQTKLTHGGRVASTIICPSARPQMATVCPGVFEKKKPDFNRSGKIISVNPQLSQVEPRLKVKGIVKADPEKIGLDEAEIIVSGGRGMGTVQNFELIKGLARSLGGVVGASLGAVDEELAPRKNLVGQTGMTVAPKLYVACGISGSIYHVLGMKDSDAIIAINKDRSAPIFKYSDMGIVGDTLEILPAIIEKVDELSERENVE